MLLYAIMVISVKSFNINLSFKPENDMHPNALIPPRQSKGTNSFHNHLSNAGQHTQAQTSPQNQTNVSACKKKSTHLRQKQQTRRAKVKTTV